MMEKEMIATFFIPKRVYALCQNLSFVSQYQYASSHASYLFYESLENYDACFCLLNLTLIAVKIFSSIANACPYYDYGYDPIFNLAIFSILICFESQFFYDVSFVLIQNSILSAVSV